ncbi:MAG: integration host factor subunit beta [Candidatus Marinimicrobia bacterium]|nr:integration host factor subunit beta [Candidatus Neomarinimicrobiota bacterium]
MSKRAKTFTKKDIVKLTARELNVNMHEIEEVVNSVFNSLREILTMRERELRIEIRNFGVFEVKQTKAKPKARNPRTNEIVFVPPRRKTHFKPGVLIKDALKEAVENLD